jgi:hypothetical protein|tara:strand:+ start:496 stop:885 length:390 start_codon:yes stop_codon:yes gene_type:complete
MATLTPTLTLTSTDATTDQLSFSVTDTLSVTAPHIGLAKLAVTTTGANNIIQPATDGQTYYVYVKHTGVDASGSVVTTTLNVELTGDVVVGKLSAGEFMFMPFGAHSLGVQLQASGGTIVAEYAYFTKA